MGINKLLPELSGSLKERHLRELAGKTAGVDLSIWLHKVIGFNSASMHQYVFRMVQLLKSHQIEPILVFDGDEIGAKAEILKERQLRKERDMIRAKQFEEEGKMDEAEKMKRRSAGRTCDVQENIKKFCRSNGIRYVQSPFEADAQLAYMAKNGNVDFVITDDSDLIAYGCDKILFKLNKEAEAGEWFDRDQLKKTWVDPHDLNCFQAVCILMGSDYYKGGLPGFGAAAAKKLYKKIAPRFSFKRMEDHLGKKVDKEAFSRALYTFRHQLVYDIETKKIVPFSPYRGGQTAKDFPYAGRLPGKGEFFIPKLKTVGRPMIPMDKAVSTYHCKDCTDFFSSAKLLKAHRERKHPIVCTICDKKFKCQAYLTEHMTSMHDEKAESTLTCDECGKVCKTRTQLRLHSRCHKAAIFACVKCPKRYKRMEQLEDHMFSHSNEKAFVCPTCGKSFRTPHTLILHKRTHSDVRPHVCDQCGKSFKRPADLREHALMHSDDRPHVCGQCGQGYKHPRDLRRHDCNRVRRTVAKKA